MVDPNYQEMELYTFATADVSKVSASLNCPFTYEFITLGESPSPVTINKLDYTIEVRPDNYSDDMGLHEFVVKACIQVEGVLTNCQASAVASVRVTDPCTASFP